jgi:hypothetical protein
VVTLLQSWEKECLFVVRHNEAIYN